VLTTVSNLYYYTSTYLSEDSPQDLCGRLDLLDSTNMTVVASECPKRLCSILFMLEITDTVKNGVVIKLLC
jgi:hypothetical protein